VTKQIETLQQVLDEGACRLSPSLTNPSWLVLSKRREIFRNWIESLPPADISVLDVGGRVQPYRVLLASRLKRYVAVDLRPTPLVNVLGSGEQLPVASDAFDLVICTQVLQYVRNPGDLLAEVHRVLKPDGYLFLSVPSAYFRDCDGDYWRFLPAGIRHLLSAFREIEVVPEGRSIAGFFRSVNIALDIFVRYPLLRSVYRHTACPVINLMGEALERLSGSPNDLFAVNYSVRARK
jgi:SAM-dependent methyltransferase